MPSSEQALQPSPSSAMNMLVQGCPADQALPGTAIIPTQCLCRPLNKSCNTVSHSLCQVHASAKPPAAPGLPGICCRCAHHWRLRRGEPLPGSWHWPADHLHQAAWPRGRLTGGSQTAACTQEWGAGTISCQQSTIDTNDRQRREPGFAVVDRR